MKYVVNSKTENLAMLNRQMLVKTLSMFEWENLPPTIPKKELERQLQTVGYSFITEINGELYALTGGLGGEVDAYGNYTEITINNVALNFNKTLSLKDDGVLICNDDLMIGLLPVFTRYNSMIVENDINLSMLGLSSRSQILLTASDTKSKASAELFLKRLTDGELSVIGENPIFDGVKALSLNTNSTNNFNSLIEFNQYLKGSLYNEVGIQANTVMKRERVNSDEVNANNDLLFPFIYNMLENRLTAIKAINEKYSENIAVDFGSIWKVKAIEKVDNIVNDVSRETHPCGSSAAAPDLCRQLGDLVVDRLTFADELADLLLRVHDGRVVAAAELLADLRQREVRELAAQVHGDLPGPGQVA